MLRRGSEGAVVTGGEQINREGEPDGSYYVRPALVEVAGQTGVVKRETFAPILYVLKFRELADAIATCRTMCRKGFLRPSSR